MMKQERPSNMNKKGAVVGLVICFVAAITIVGTYTFKRYNDGMKEELAKAESQEKDIQKKNMDEARTTNTDNIVLPSTTTNTETQKEDNTSGTNTNSTETNQAAPTAGTSAQVSFGENDMLQWPISGNVIMNYSMDKTIYFATLDQYKYNPAIMIGGATDTAVVAGARGIVKSIEEKAQTGNTMTIDMGNGYEAVYGQLKDIPVLVGKLVEAGETIGTLSEPTKYYSVEGCNLYFQLLKDGEPVNPMEYLDN
ncbi:peptidoglycan DD-metalloendopeptidase family protein [Lachnospiraceae bacterium LCP25S3_G4]